MSILEFHAINPLTYPSPFLLSNLRFLLSQVVVVLSFAFAAFYIIKYLRKFYGERQIPEEWKIFWVAMVLGTVHELIEVPLLYQWVVGQVLLVVFFIIQVVAGIYLIKGSYLLAKKHIIG
ncbi:hypothetical protein ACFL0A_00240 [Patescibacteria group bacterium]